VSKWHQEKPSSLSEEERELQVTLARVNLDRVAFDRRVYQQVLAHDFVKSIEEMDKHQQIPIAERMELSSLLLDAVTLRKRRLWDMGKIRWSSKIARSALRLHSNPRVFAFFNLVLLALCCLVVVEPAQSWAYSPGFGPWIDGKACIATAEFLLVLTIDMDFILMLMYRGFEDLCIKSQYRLMHRLNLLVSILLTTDALMNMVVQNGLLGEDIYILRWGRPLRPLFFLFLHPTLRDAALSCGQSINSLFDLGVLTLVFLTFFALIGVVLFSDGSGNEGLETGRIHGVLVMYSDGFQSVEQAFLTLFVLLTYDNFLRVMNITQSAGPGCVMFVVVFVVVTFVIMGVVVAIVYEFYKDARSLQVISMKMQERRVLLGAFAMADNNGNGILDITEFVGMLSATSMGYQHADAKVIFERLDVDRSGTVTKSEFLDLCDVLLLKHYELEVIGAQVFGNRRAYSNTFEKIVEGRRFEVFSLSITVAFCLMIVLEASSLVSVDREGELRKYTNRCFLLLFSVEACTKILGTPNGLKGYWSSRWNRFDFVLVGLGWLEFLASFTYGHDETIVVGDGVGEVSVDSGAAAAANGVLLLRVVRLCQLARVSRLISVLHHVQRLRALVMTFAQSVSMLFELSGLVVFVWYFYAVLGMEMFYGLLSEANTDEVLYAQQLQRLALLGANGNDLDATDSNFTFPVAPVANVSVSMLLARQQDTVQACSIWCEDFDGFFSASLVLFQVLTRAGWSNVMYRSMSVYGLGAQTYWTSYTLFIAIIMLNLVSALLLDLYSAQLQRAAAMLAEKNELLQSIVDSVLIDDEDDEEEDDGTDDLDIDLEAAGSGALKKKIRQRAKLAKQVATMQLLSSGIRSVFDRYAEPLDMELARKVAGSSKRPGTGSNSRPRSTQNSRKDWRGSGRRTGTDRSNSRSSSTKDPGGGAAKRTGRGIKRTTRVESKWVAKRIQ
jgi:hypothetical protein